jgi:hypothetical protein
MTVAPSAGPWQRLQPRERILVGIVAVIGLLAVVYLLFVGGGERQLSGLPTPAPRATPTRLAPSSPTPTPTGRAAPETFEVFEGKDPFRPLVGPGAPTPGPSPGPTGGPRGAQRVTLVEITGSGASRTATVRVGSTEYRVRVGDTFAGSYRVVSLGSRCGTFSFGDEQFTLCEGQEVLK